MSQGHVDLGHAEAVSRLARRRLLGNANSACAPPKHYISIIEAKHASIRRQLTARSVQTWALKMATASAEWLCQHIRRGKLSKLSGPSACPLPLQLLHCQQLRAVRARRLQRQGPLSWRVSTSTLASDIISLPW